jgi:hypothetical protein
LVQTASEQHTQFVDMWDEPEGNALTFRDGVPLKRIEKVLVFHSWLVAIKANDALGKLVFRSFRGNPVMFGDRLPIVLAHAE